MKKIVFFSLFGSLFLLTACGAPTSKSASSNTPSTSITSNGNVTSTTEKGSSTDVKTASSSAVKETSNTQISQVQGSISSTKPSQVSSETAAPSTSVEPANTNSISTQEEALQLLTNSYTELQNEDIVVRFYKMIGVDYLFSATSKSIQSQGGSGTVGFYRVSPEGNITKTDAFGNPL